MDDLLTAVGKNFSFVEILCFCLLWRIETTLKKNTDAINKLLKKVAKDNKMEVDFDERD